MTVYTVVQLTVGRLSAVTTAQNVLTRALAMNRLSILTLALCTSVIACSQDKPAKPARQVILVVLDAARADRFGAQGYSRETTPYMHALAEIGIWFENYCAQATSKRRSIPLLIYSHYFTKELFPHSHPMSRVTLLSGSSLVPFQNLVDELLHPLQLGLRPLSTLSLRWHRAVQSLAHHPTVYAELLGYSLNRPYSVLVLSPHLLEQSHLGTPFQPMPPFRARPGRRLSVSMRVGQIKRAIWARSV